MTINQQIESGLGQQARGIATMWLKISKLDPLDPRMELTLREMKGAEARLEQMRRSYASLRLAQDLELGCVRR